MPRGFGAEAAMERETGIEPAPSAWKAEVLPLNYSRAGRLLLHRTRRRGYNDRRQTGWAAPSARTTTLRVVAEPAVVLIHLWVNPATFPPVKLFTPLKLVEGGGWLRALRALGPSGRAFGAHDDASRRRRTSGGSHPPLGQPGHFPAGETLHSVEAGGGRWIRTTEGVSQQIYSLPPLAAWVSLQKSPQFWRGRARKSTDDDGAARAWLRR